MQQQTLKIALAIVITVLVTSGAHFMFYISKQNVPPKINSDLVFDKQRQCVLLREEAMKKMEGDFKMATPFFYDIFYSPVTDSCLYSYGLLLAGESPNEIGSFNLVDYFSGKTIVSEKYDNSSANYKQNSPDIREKWNQEVKKYMPN
ncbi:MAG: hypothetical protein Q8O95_00800 [bacterium]|nr:hypothetical protein [bacterium]